jgi:hypothetical protein
MDDGQPALGQRERFKRRQKEKCDQDLLRASEGEKDPFSSESMGMQQDIVLTDTVSERMGTLRLSEAEYELENDDGKSGPVLELSDKNGSTAPSPFPHENQALAHQQQIVSRSGRERGTARSRPQAGDDDEEEAAKQDVYQRCTHFICFQIDSLTILQRAATIQVMPKP